MMKCPGYIEGPWFPPEIRKPVQQRIRLNSTRQQEAENNDESDVDLDDVDFVVLPARSKDYALLRPGRAERVIVIDEDNSRMEPSKEKENQQLASTSISASYQSEFSEEPSSKCFGDTGAFAKQTSRTSNTIEQAMATADRIIQDSKGDLSKMTLLDKSAPAPASGLSPCLAVEPSEVHAASNAEDPLQQAPVEATFFTKMSTSFTQVRVDTENNIDTEQFLNACKEIPKFLDLLGGRAMAPVKADMNGNIDNLEKEFQASPDTTKTLQDMLLRENPGKARGSLLWLNRGLQFLDCFLHELLNSEAETAECVRRAYDNSLRPHHNFAVRAVFRTVLFAVPSRKVFLALLFGSTKEDLFSPGFAPEYEKFLLDARRYSEALHNLVSVILKFYEERSF